MIKIVLICGFDPWLPMSPRALGGISPKTWTEFQFPQPCPSAYQKWSKPSLRRSGWTKNTSSCREKQRCPMKKTADSRGVIPSSRSFNMFQHVSTLPCGSRLFKTIPMDPWLLAVEASLLPRTWRPWTWERINLWKSMGRAWKKYVISMLYLCHMYIIYRYIIGILMYIIYWYKFSWK